MTPCGVLYVDKPSGMTSHDVVNRIRKLYDTRQVGHTGTLDPMASGVLTLLVGRAVKASEYLSADSKGYEAKFILGKRTDTGDSTGKVTFKTDDVPSENEVIAVSRRFEGDIMQTPPMYSALKVGGKKLVDLARKGIEVERAPRLVRVDRLEVTRLENGEYSMIAEVSKGTYIRTLITDIGDALGCGACMTYLRRTRCGNAWLDLAHTPDEIGQMSEEERIALLRPVESAFTDCKEIVLPAFFEKLARDGNEIYLSKIGEPELPVGSLVRLCGERGFFALGEVREYECGNAVKPVKQFDI